MTPMRERLAGRMMDVELGVGAHIKAPEAEWNLWRTRADACLRELETPSDGMVEAGMTEWFGPQWQTINDAQSLPYARVPPRVFAAMIRAALEGK